MFITVETSRCIGCGSCVDVAPEAFGFDEDGIVVLLDPSPLIAEEVVQCAVLACPSASTAVQD